MTPSSRSTALLLLTAALALQLAAPVAADGGEERDGERNGTRRPVRRRTLPHDLPVYLLGIGGWGRATEKCVQGAWRLALQELAAAPAQASQTAAAQLPLNCRPTATARRRDDGYNQTAVARRMAERAAEFPGGKAHVVLSTGDNL